MPETNSNGTLRDAAHPETITIDRYKRALLTEKPPYLPRASWAKTYIEPEIVEEIIETEEKENGEKKEKRYSLDDLVHINLPMVITGEMGMGKSALSRELVLRLLDNGKIPVYIDLNGKSNVDIQSLIKTNINYILGGQRENIDTVVSTKLEKGDLFVVFDGLDEASDKKAVIKSIRDFHGEYKKTKFLVTSRTNSYHGDLPFKVAEIKGYRESIKELTDENFNKLIAESTILTELGQNPKYRGMMNDIYIKEGKLDITNVSDLFDRWLDSELDKRPKILSARDRRKIYQHLAFTMQAENRSRYLSKEIVEGLLEDFVTKNTGLRKKHEPKDAVDEIMHDNLITEFKKDGKSQVKFTDTPIQEYLCAREINRRLVSDTSPEQSKGIFQKWYRGIKSFFQRKSTERLTVGELWNLVSYDDFTNKIGVGGRNLNPKWKETLQFLSGIASAENIEKLVGYIVEPCSNAEIIATPYRQGLFRDELSVAVGMAKVRGISCESLTKELNELLECNNYHDAYQVLGDIGYYSPKMLDHLCESTGSLETEFGNVTISLVGDTLIKIGHYDPKLIRLIEHENPNISKISARIVSKIGSFDPRLVKMLDHENPQVVGNAAKVLGKLGHFNPKLAELLSHEDSYVLMKAAFSLGELGHFDQRLERLLSHPDRFVICDALTALTHLNHFNPKIIDLLEHKEYLVKYLASVALSKMSHDNPKLIELLKHEDPDIARLATDSLATAKHYAPHIVELLKHENPDVIHRAIDILSKWSYYCSELSGLINHPSRDVARKAAKALGEFGKYGPLLELLKTEENHSKSFTIRALGELKHYDPELSRILREEKDTFLLEKTVVALGKIGYFDPKLIELLDHDNFHVVLSGINALIELDHYDSKLTELLTHDNSLVVGRAIESLDHFRHYHPTLEKLLDHPSFLVATKSALTLGRLGNYDHLNRLLDRASCRQDIEMAMPVLMELKYYDPRMLDLLEKVTDTRVTICIDHALRKIAHYDPRMMDWIKEGKNVRTLSSTLYEFKQKLEPTGY